MEHTVLQTSRGDGAFESDKSHKKKKKKEKRRSATFSEIMEELEGLGIEDLHGG